MFSATLTMAVVKSRCPVPPEQLPINQYEDMSQSWFYRWGSCGWWAYHRPILILWGISWAFSGPVAAASFAPSRYPVPFFIWASAGALILPVLTLAQLYVGWLHIGQRLKQEAVPYEESGWYDGQIWQKPDDVLNRDRLIMAYEVQPILNRTKAAIAALVGIGVVLIGAQRFL